VPPAGALGLTVLLVLPLGCSLTVTAEDYLGPGGPPPPPGVAGHLWVVGGADEAGGELSAVWVAPILEDGALGAWARATDLPSPRTGHASFVHDDRIYVVGGRYTNTLFAVRTGADLGAWSFGETPTALHEYPCVAASRSSVFQVAGASSCPAPLPASEAAVAVSVGELSADGKIAWTSTEVLPYPRCGCSAVATDGFVYAINGLASITETDAVPGSTWFAPIGLANDAASWAPVTAPQGPIQIGSGHASVATDGRIYVMGGVPNSGSSAGRPVADVWIADVRELDGSLSWRTSAEAALPLPLAWHAAAIHGRFVYVLGGLTLEDRPIADVFRARIGQGGLEPWQATRPLPTAIWQHAAAASPAP
jgi:hypothetical protein